MIRMFLALIALAFMASDAMATMRCFWCSDGYRSAVSRHHKTRHHKPKRHHHEGPKHTERKVIIHVEPENLGAECVDQRISVVSSPHHKIDVAQDAARTQWSARTQYTVGGLYMDPAISRDRKWLCSVTNADDSVRDATLPKLYRCYFSARPCRKNIQFDDHE